MICLLGGSFIILQSDYAKDVAQPTLTSKRVVQADYCAHPENYNPVFHEKIAPLCICNCELHVLTGRNNLLDY
ncbi:unnamed protein product [Prunus armeniaca]|uniref:Uncharacterized protein n=1 Tax=Prunus armeniaca TaxID=36596 RepID=A0A6J5Y3B1_PRUAR|nr:unnamed protein product [Prunus armeniaca]CAB4318415.1 unnamed protein product [Prunus armeniaca]